MSREDRLRQTSSLLLIRSDEGFTCKRATEIGAVFSLSSLISLQEHPGLMKRTQSCLSQRYWHFFFSIYLEWDHIVSHEQKIGGFNLPLLKDDEFYYVQRSTKTSVLPLFKSRSQKIQCTTSVMSVGNRKYAMLSIPPAPSHMQ